MPSSIIINSMSVGIMAVGGILAAVIGYFLFATITAARYATSMGNPKATERSGSIGAVIGLIIGLVLGYLFTN